MPQIVLEPVPPPAPIIDPVNFRDGVIYPIADLLGIDPAKDISEARLRRWGNSASRHVRFAWDFWAWDQLTLTEERAFRPIWNALHSWTNGDEIFDIASQAYYEVTGGTPPIGTLPNDPLWFSPLTLGVDDYTIPLRQGCRRKIGRVRAVYPANPRTMASARVQTLPFTVSERGIEVLGSGPTVFVRYQLPPFRYTGRKWSSGADYLPESLVYYLGAGEDEDGAGEVYRAIRPVTGTLPNDENAGLLWALVPFPAFLADYVVYMVAAEDAEDLATARAWATMAPDFLKNQVDGLLAQGGPRNRFGAPAGYNYWGTSSPYYQIPPSEVVNTISDVCVNQWGDPQDVATPGRVIWLRTPGSGTFTPDPGARALYVEVVGGGGGSAGALGTVSTGAASGGGAGGSYAAKYYANPAMHYTYKVGAGGAAGNAAPTAGGDGGDTVFGALTGFGAGGSVVPLAGTSTGLCGVAGRPAGSLALSSGDVFMSGGKGGMGLRFGVNGGGYGGSGGTSRWAGSPVGAPAVNWPGIAGYATGGGASGASSASATGQPGAAGAAGAIKITEFF